MTPRSRTLLVPLFLLASVHASAQQRDTTAQLAGVVFSAYTGQPLAGATVETPYGRTMTDSLGRFALAALPPGTQPVLFSYRGQYSQELTARLKRGHVLRWTVVLNPDTEAIQLPPILVQGEGREWRFGLAGFYERRAKAWGRFYAYQDLERLGSLPLRALLGESGIWLRCSLGQCRAIDMSQCSYAVYEDGWRSSAEDIDRIRVSDLAGVELYQRGSQVPMAFATTIGKGGYPITCGGIIAVWSRYLN